jgi:tetratricopeptide (TPR) repeat protein
MAEENSSDNSILPNDDQVPKDKISNTTSPPNNGPPPTQTRDKGHGDSPTPSDGQQLGQYLRLSFRIFGSLAGAAGLLYALGFLVVNISLLSYGVYEVGLLRERYVSAGAAFILLLLIIAVFWFWFIPKGLTDFLSWLKNIWGRFINWLKSKNWSRLQLVHRYLRTMSTAVGKKTSNIWGLRRIYNYFENHGLAKLFILLVILLALLVISFLATLFLGFIWKITTVPSEWLNAIVGLTDPSYRSQRASNILSTMPVFIWCVLVSLIFAVWLGFQNWRDIISDYIGTAVQVEKDKEDKKRTATKKDKDTPTIFGEFTVILTTLKENWSYLLITLLLFFALVVYARDVFPALPAAMGGGLPTVVQFSARDEQGLQELVQLGIPVEENKPNLTRQITLIAQTGNSYIVLISHPELKQNVAVAIPKDHVDGIIYYPEEYFLNDDYVAELRTQEGRDALAQGDYLTAIAMFSKALDRKGNYSSAIIGLGDAYVAQFIAEEDLCEGENCIIRDAIEKYKEVLIELRKGVGSGNHVASEADQLLLGETLYKLAQAYALFPPDLEDAILFFRCPDVTGLGDGGTGEQSKDRVTAATVALECAILWDEATGSTQNYAERAKSDEYFHLQDGTLRTNKKFLVKIFSSLPDAVSGYKREAINLQELGQLNEAIKRYTWAIDILEEQEIDLDDPDKVQAELHNNRAGLYLQLHNDGYQCENNGCLEKAIEDYKKAKTLEANNIVYLTNLANAHLNENNTEAAMLLFMQATRLAESASYTEAWLGLAQTHLIQEEFVEAREAYSQTISIQPTNAAAYYGRARAEASIGENPDQVILDLRQAITLDETLLKSAEEEFAFEQISDINDLLSAKRLFEDGQQDEREGNLDNAIQNYEEAIKLDGVNDAYHAALANAYSELPKPRWNDAEQAYLQAINLSPANDNYHFNLGEVYNAQAKFDEAVESFATAIDINDQKAIYFDRLSGALIKVGLYNDAFNAGEKAIALESDNLDYRFNLAEIYRQIEGWDRAVVNYDIIIEQDPAYGDAYCGLAITLYQRNKRGDIERADKVFDDCQKLSLTDHLKEQADLAKKSFDVRQSGTDQGN